MCVGDYSAPSEARDWVAGGARLGTLAEERERAEPVTVPTITGTNARRKWERQAVVARLLSGTTPREGEKEYRTRYCCRSVKGGDGELFVATTASERVMVGGYLTCGSRWLCPVCAEKLAHEDRAGIQRLLDEHQRRGKVAVFVTLTVPSRKSDSLEHLIAAVREARTRASQSARWRYIRSRCTVLGVVQALELTWSEGSGWHPHLHEIWLLDLDQVSVMDWDDASDSWRAKPLKAKPSGHLDSRTFRKALHQDLGDAWADAVENITGRRPHGRFGVDVSVVEEGSAVRLARYMTKTDDDGVVVEQRIPAHAQPASSEWTPADELARGIVKKGRKAKGDDGVVVPSLTFWQIVDRAAARDPQAIALVHEFAAATWNRDALVKPVKLMEACGVNEPEAVLTDDGVVDDGDPVIVTVTLDRDSWSNFRQTVDIAPVGAILLKVREVKERKDPDQWDLDMFVAMLELGWERVMPGSNELIFRPPGGLTQN